jgi:hypothetical protein
MAALVQRQHQLIACLGKVNDATASSASKAMSKVREADAELISIFSQSIARKGAADLESEGEEPIQLLALLGEGVVSGAFDGEAVH